MVYKSWFEEVEHRAIDTLKGAVAKLLANFDDQVNSKYYDGDGLTKKGQFEKILSLMEGYTTTPDVQNTKAAANGAKKTKKRGRKMTSTKRDYDYINQLLDETVREDLQLNTFLNTDQAEIHPLVAEVQSHARD